MKSVLRLRQSADFARVRRNGTLHKHYRIMLNCAENPLSHNRYGFVTSKKVGGAVIRNLVKRRLREATYQIHPHLHQGYDVVIIARPSVVEQPFEELLRILNKLFRQAKLLKEE